LTILFERLVATVVIGDGTERRLNGFEIQDPPLRPIRTGFGGGPP
jgi:hypothetical protein